MQNLLDTLTTNMQIIYRKAVDADNALDKLKQGGKGNFKQIFADNSAFTTQSTRFMPYVEELAEQIAPLSNQQADQVVAELPKIVSKIELMLTTLNQFEQSLRR